MFDKAIIDTDRFMDLSMSSKALYFLLGMEADDEGFVSFKKVMRIHGGNEDDIKVLVAKEFLIMFESGVVVITDWQKNNWLDSRRICKTEYQKESKMLDIDSEKRYCLADAKPMLRENSIEQNRIEENSIEEYKPTDKKSVDKKPKYNDFDIKMVNLLKGFIIDNNPLYNSGRKEFKINEESWANSIRLMRTADKYNEDEIELLIRWCQNDDFWKKNILSTSKLRKQSDRLILEAKSQMEKVNNKVVAV